MALAERPECKGRHISRRDPAEPSAGPLLTQLLARDPRCIGGCGDGSRLPINNLTKLVPADGSGPVLQTPQCSLAAIWGTNSVDSETCLLPVIFPEWLRVSVKPSGK